MVLDEHIAIAAEVPARGPEERPPERLVGRVDEMAAQDHEQEAPPRVEPVDGARGEVWIHDGLDDASEAQVEVAQ